MSKQQKLEVTLIDSLEDITLGQWQRYNALENPTVEDMVSIYCNVPSNRIKELDMYVFDMCLSSIDSYFKELEKSKSLVSIFRFKEQDFGFIPNLDKISLGEYLDLGKYLQEVGTYHLAMSVLYRKVTQRVDKQYLIANYDLEEASKYNMKDVPLYVALSAIDFIAALAEDLVKAIPNYISRQLEEYKKTLSTEELATFGESMSGYISSGKEMSEDLMKLQNFLSINASPTLLTHLQKTKKNSKELIK